MSPDKSTTKDTQNRSLQTIIPDRTQTATVATAPVLTIKKPRIRRLVPATVIDDSKPRVSTSANLSAPNAVSFAPTRLHPRHRRVHSVVTSEDDALVPSTANGALSDLSTVVQSSLLTSEPQSTPPKSSLQSRVSTCRVPAKRKRGIEFDDAYMDTASESSASSEEWHAITDDVESNTSETSLDSRDLGDELAFICEIPAPRAGSNRTSRTGGALGKGDNGSPSSLNTRPRWDEAAARRRYLRKRAQIERSPPPRVGPSQSILRKRRRVEVATESTDLHVSSEAPSSSATGIASSSHEERSTPPKSEKPVAVRQGSFFSVGEYTFRFTRQTQNYAIPEDEYRDNGGVVIDHGQFMSTTTGRPGEMNVLWLLLHDSQWLAHHDQWSEYRVPTAPRPAGN
ncbi:unnamed protein product [Peniophora sp. CBMAI 1063]|nr:unnamed protein product [Peniophora sp. CBMAI 1063]